MCLLVGLTGGIGSGKTTVAKVFELLDVPVYYADAEAKKLMNEDEQLQKNITRNFGSHLYKNGKLDTAALAKIVFSHKEKLTLLNKLVHPVTIAHAALWQQQQTAAYVIKEAALLFESDAWKKIDYSIGVQAPQYLRLQRARQRDGSSTAAVKARMSKQMDEKEKMNRCDFLLKNNEKVLLLPQILALHQKLLSLPNL